jgi:hypothetical protein
MGRTKGLAKTHWQAGFAGFFSPPEKQKAACEGGFGDENFFDFFSGCLVKIHRAEQPTRQAVRPK